MDFVIRNQKISRIISNSYFVHLCYATKAQANTNIKQDNINLNPDPKKSKLALNSLINADLAMKTFPLKMS